MFLCTQRFSVKVWNAAHKDSCSISLSFPCHFYWHEKTNEEEEEEECSDLIREGGKRI